MNGNDPHVPLDNQTPQQREYRAERINRELNRPWWRRMLSYVTPNNLWMILLGVGLVGLVLAAKGLYQQGWPDRLTFDTSKITDRLNKLDGDFTPDADKPSEFTQATRRVLDLEAELAKAREALQEEATKTNRVIIDPDTGNVIPTTPVTVPPDDAEIYLPENPTADQIAAAEQHRDSRARTDQLAALQSQMDAVQKQQTKLRETMEGGIKVVRSTEGVDLTGVVLELLRDRDSEVYKAVKRIARYEVEYYWNNHDEVADKRGYRNVIRWENVNY